MSVSNSAIDRDAAGRSRHLRTLVTPEGLALSLELAALGSRFAAFAIDFGLMALATALLVALALGLASAAGFDAATLVVVILVSFFIWNGYFVFFELTWRGSTPGKRAVGLRVISNNGGPLTTSAVFARNLMRELELYLPLQMLFTPELFYGPAPGWTMLLASAWIFLFLFMPLFNRDRARCGDLVAGTLVVVRPESHLRPDAAELYAGAKVEQRYPFTDEQLDMYGIKELQVLEDILHRDAWDPHRFSLLRTVADKITYKIGWREPVLDAQVQEFLQAFYRAQRRRLEGRLLLGERRERKRLGRLKRK